jgi:hypothetical protein
MTVKEKESDHSIIKCDKCGESFCSNCSPKHRYIKWILCRKCNEPIKQRRERIKEFVKKRKEQYKLKTQYMGFGVSLRLTKDIKVAFEMLSNCYDEAVILLTKDKIIVKSMDPSKITVIKCEIQNNLFQHILKLEIPELRLAWNLNDLNKIISCFQDDRQITISRASGEKKIIISDENLTLTMNDDLGDIEDPYFNNLNQIDYPLDFKPEPIKFFNTLSACKELSDFFEIIYSGENLRLKAERSKISLVYLFNCPIKHTDDKIDVCGKTDILTSFLKLLIENIKSMKISINTFQAPRVQEPEYDDED